MRLEKVRNRHNVDSDNKYDIDEPQKKHTVTIGL